MVELLLRKPLWVVRYWKCGYSCQNPIKVTINGGNITANAKGEYGVDIGSGGNQSSEININGGTITCEKVGVGADK